ncbi:hypothetical protein EV714DRAFT_270983 [Schizophyllum commune]
MSFPASGSYYTFHLDPVASLQDIEDEEVIKAAREIQTSVYVACTIGNVGVPQPPPAYETTSSLGCVFLSDRILNTRRAAGPLIAATHCSGMDAITSRVQTERVALSSMLRDDEERRVCLRDCAAKGLPPPPASPSDMALASARAADREISDTPYWQILAAEEEADRLAWGDADSAYSDATGYSGEGDDDASSSGSAHTGGDAEDGTAMDAQAANAIAEVEDDILAALTYRADLGNTSPVIVPLSYDLSTLPEPPSPTGFMEELKVIKKLRSDYEERVRRLKEEVQRRDDEYMADIQARRVAEPPVKSKWPLLGGFVPFTNKVKARLVTLRSNSASPASSSPSKVKPGKLRLLMFSSVWKRSARS